MKRRYDLFLKDMLDAVERIEEYTQALDIEDFRGYEKASRSREKS